MGLLGTLGYREISLHDRSACTPQNRCEEPFLAMGMANCFEPGNPAI